MFSVRRFRSGGLCGGIAAALLGWLAFSHPAAAQLALPGAVAPEPEGTVQHPDAAARPKRRTTTEDGVRIPTPAAVPSPAALAGRTLSLNGDKTQVTFETHEKQLAVTKLTLAGESMDDTHKSCTVDGGNAPLATTTAGRPDGVERVQVDFPACPIAFDVLEGAVLVDRTQSACEFKEANCRINPVGLWGPQSGELGPDKQKGIEKGRAAAERSVRDIYQALVHSTKDRTAIMGFARDQAQFSSTREEICRDYIGEGRHGFCAEKLTEARAAFLRAELDGALIKKAEKKKKQRAARTR